jgi:hypothetical protein
MEQTLPPPPLSGIRRHSEVGARWEVRFVVT